MAVITLIFFAQFMILPLSAESVHWRRFSIFLLINLVQTNIQQSLLTYLTYETTKI